MLCICLVKDQKYTNAMNGSIKAIVCLVPELSEIQQNEAKPEADIVTNKEMLY